MVTTDPREETQGGPEPSDNNDYFIFVMGREDDSSDSEDEFPGHFFRGHFGGRGRGGFGGRGRGDFGCRGRGHFGGLNAGGHFGGMHGRGGFSWRGRSHFGHGSHEDFGRHHFDPHHFGGRGGFFGGRGRGDFSWRGRRGDFHRPCAACGGGSRP